MNTAKFLRTRISKNICERLFLIVVIYCIKNGIKLLRSQIGIIKSLYLTCSHSYSFVLSLSVIHCHLLSFFLVVVIHCHYLSFVVTGCTTCCHWLHHSLSLVFIRCTTRCHSLPLFVTCTTRLSFYKRSVHDRKESRLAKYYRIKSKLTKISYVLHK